MIIFLEDKQSYSKSREAELLSISSHPNKNQKVLQQVENLKSTLDLRNRTATADTEGSTLQNDKSQYELDSFTLSDDDYEQDISISRTISSISLSSFSDISNCSLNLLTEDPLCILGLKGDDREMSSVDGHIDKSRVNEIEYKSCTSHNDENYEIMSGGLNMFTWGDVCVDIDIIDTKGDSFISYEGLISEGLSYDENDEDLYNTHTYNLNYSKDERVDLDQFCEESLQSCD